MELKKIIEHRNIWLGFAMVWILLYHSKFDFNFAYFSMFKKIGYGGVDICFLASGIGCYFSLNKDFDILGFLKRRFFRIMPTYLCFIFPWFILEGIKGNLSVQMMIGNILGIQNFTGLGNSFNWYISALLLFYFFAPFFKLFADRANVKHLIIGFIILLAISFSFWNAQTYIITVTRIPIFMLGFFIGKLCSKHDYTINISSIIILVITMIAGLTILIFFIRNYAEFLWSYGLYWYPFILITPGLCLCISYFVFLMQKSKCLNWIPKVLEKIGQNSLELYLLHIPFFNVIIYFINSANLENYNNIIWVLGFVLIPLIVICFKTYMKFILRLFRTKCSA